MNLDGVDGAAEYDFASEQSKFSMNFQVSCQYPIAAGWEINLD